jgi:hypothetical protein
MHRPIKIISGGQTGADIGGLVGAKRVGISTGGTAPREFKTEVGSKPEELKAFGLIPHSSPNYKDRTRENVLNSNATLIIATDPGSDGTKLTIKYCEELGKPYLMIDPNDDCINQVRNFIESVTPSILNIAGNRESKSKGLAARTAAIIETTFSRKNR